MGLVCVGGRSCGVWIWMDVVEQRGWKCVAGCLGGVWVGDENAVNSEPCILMPTFVSQEASDDNLDDADRSREEGGEEVEGEGGCDATAAAAATPTHAAAAAAAIGGAAAAGAGGGGGGGGAVGGVQAEQEGGGGGGKRRGPVPRQFSCVGPSRLSGASEEIRMMKAEVSGRVGDSVGRCEEGGVEKEVGPGLGLAVRTHSLPLSLTHTHTHTFTLSLSLSLSLFLSLSPSSTAVRGSQGGEQPAAGRGRQGRLQQ